MTDNATRRFRALFISDVHLGTRGCQADKLLDFLRHHDAETVYLVGDIVDGWALQLVLVLAADTQRCRAETSAAGAQGRAVDLHPRQPRRISARLLRHAFRRHRGRGKYNSHRPRRPPLSGRSRRHFRSGGDAGALARAPRRQSLRIGAYRQPRVQCLPPRLRCALLVACPNGRSSK